MKKIFALLFVVIAFIIATFMHFMSNNSLIQIVGESVKNGNVQVLTKNLDVKVQDDVINIKIPNNCFYRKTELKLKAPKGEKLTVKFASPKVSETKTTGIFRKIQPRRKYIDNGRINVAYKSVKINGKSIKKQKFKTAKKSYDRHITANKNGEINISFKHKLVPDYRLDVQPHVYLLLFVLLIAFLSEKYKDRDWFKCLVDGYKSIDPVYRKSFWIIFITVNCVFAFHTINMMHGNHAYTVLFSSDNIDSYFNMGRYSSTLFKVLFLDGQFVPVLTNLLMFFFSTLAFLLLCKYWKFAKKTSVFVICGLLFLLQPYIIEWLFYIEGQPDISVAQLFVILGFLTASKSINSVSKLKYNLLSIFCFIFALGVYPSIISTIAVLFTGKLFVDSFDYDGTKEKFKTIIFNQKYAFVNIVLSGLIFKIIVSVLKHMGIVQDLYVIKSLKLSQMPLRFLACIKASFEHLYSYQFPFMPNCLAEIFAILLIILVFLILMNNNNELSVKANRKVKFVQLSVLFLTLIFTQAAVMLCKAPMFFEPRMDYFGILYFKILIVGVLLSKNYSINIKNITTVLCIGILFVSVVNDLLALKVWYLGYRAEKMEMNRLIYKIENHENYNPDMTYYVIQAGQNISIRKKMYNTPLLTNDVWGMLIHPLLPNWKTFTVLQYYMGKNFVRKNYYLYHTRKSNINNGKLLIKLYDAGVLQKAMNSNENLFIYDDIILYVTEKEQLQCLIDKTKAFIKEGRK